jgi:hypothetical protein
MTYIKAVLKTLSELGIAETDLSAADFTAISEWEKQEIPQVFLIHVLKELLTEPERLHTSYGAIADLESRVVLEYVEYLERHSRLDQQLTANAA